MTCPACRRPEATPKQALDVEYGDEAMSQAVCYAAALDCDPDCDGEIDAVALLAMARCVPPRALAEMARVLRFGGAARGCGPAESGGGQTVADHLRHAEAHLFLARKVGHGSRDAETGALDAVHAACRAALAAELVLAGEETGR